MNIQFADIMIRLGWAFLCGLCCFMVPLLLRKAFHAGTRTGRIVAAVFALLFTAAAVALGCCLWDKYVPKEPPPPATLPSLPPAAPLDLPQ